MHIKINLTLVEDPDYLIYRGVGLDRERTLLSNAKNFSERPPSVPINLTTKAN